MALDFNVLAQTPSVVQRFYQGREDVRREAEQNMLRQQRALQMQQAQEDRERALERQRRQDAVYKQAADVLRQYGKNPDDPQVLQEGVAKATEAGNMQIAQVFSGMLAEAQKRQQERAYRTEYEQMYGGGAAPAAAGAPAAAAPQTGQMTSTLIDRGVRQPDVAPPAITAAQAFPVAPLAGTPIETPMAPTTNALAAAPAAAGANALAMPADPFAAQRDQALRDAASLNPLIANRGKMMLQQLPRMEMPESAGRPISVSPGATLMSPTGQILGTAPAAPETPAQRERLRLDAERVRLEGLRADIDQQRIRAQESRDAATQKRAEEAALRAERQLAQAEKRLSMAEEQARRAADPEFQARITAARTEAQLTAKDDMAALSQGPAAVEGGMRSLALLNRMVGDPKAKGVAAQPHPGFTGTVGMTFAPGMRFVPGTPEADFQGMLDQVKGGAFLEAYERLKGTGQITEIEGKKATDAITRMSTAISENEFMQAAKELREVIQAGIDRTNSRISKAQGRQRGGVTPAAPAAPAAPVAGTIQDGYRFKGGDPSVESNWEKL
jgi:hypothetical protein